MTVNDNAIEKVVDASNNTLTATDGKYTVNDIDFALALNEGVPSATYDLPVGSADTTLANTSYTFTVGEKAIEVIIVDGAITKVNVNNTEVCTAAGTYVVDNKSLKVAYADGALTAQTADINSPDISSAVNENATTYSMTYTFKVGEKTVSVETTGDSITYNGESVTDNKITVDGVEVTLNVDNNVVTGATYLGSYSDVGNVSQNIIETGTESSRDYVIGVGDDTYTININFDDDGNISAISTAAQNVTVNNKTLTIGDYTLTFDGTKDNLSLETVTPNLNDIESNQLFLLGGIANADGITVDNTAKTVTLKASNLNGEAVTLTNSGSNEYKLALADDVPQASTSATNGWTALSNNEATYYIGCTESYTLAEDAKSISCSAAQADTNQFTLKGIKTTEGITVDENGIITITAANIIDNPTEGSKIEFTVADGVTTDYTLALADDAPKSVDDPENIAIELANGTTTIDKDGLYKFAADYTGTLTIASTAKNVRLVGAGSQLFNVYIDASAVTGANLWIENLDINSGDKINVIKFGSGTNYLTVKGTNSLIDTASYGGNDKALINVGGGLNIIGDGSLTAKLDSSWTWVPAIGSDRYQNLSSSAINIGGSVTLDVEVNGGGQIIGAGSNNGSIGNISIGSTAKVSAKTDGNDGGIGSGGYQVGSVGTVTYGKNATINGTKGTVDNVTADNIIARFEPTNAGYDWIDLIDGSSTRRKLTKTAGYTLDGDQKTLTYAAEEYTDLFTLKGIKSTEGITVENGVDKSVVTISKANLIDNPTEGATVELTVVEGNNHTLAVADDILPVMTAEGDPFMMSGTGGYTISVDGVYQFAEGFSGTVKIESTAKNVRIIGAGSQLSNVYIDASAVTDANLWIEDLNIRSTVNANVIKFGSSTNNYLTVKGENTLVNTYSSYSAGSAVINVGGGLNIIGDGSLTVQLTGGYANSAAIGSNRFQNLSSSAINIGGNVTIDAYAKFGGAGIGSGQKGSIGNIFIGGKATVGSSTGLEDVTGIGKGYNGSVGTITYGKNATVTNKGTVITDEQKTDNVSADSLTEQTEIIHDLYGYMSTSDDALTYKKMATTAGYNLNETANNTLTYHAPTFVDGDDDSFTIKGITSTDELSVVGKTVIVKAAALKQEEVTIVSEDYTLALASDVSVPTKTAAHFTDIVDSETIYKSESSSAGYTWRLIPSRSVPLRRWRRPISSR
ncbi:MAG: hypothetical protein IJ668_10160 [Selenomonadaceae bacterium]|nr:hypothetical protein [Selenomonadaceae bacterium]